MENRPRNDRDSIDEIISDAEYVRIARRSGHEISLMVRDEGRSHWFSYRSQDSATPLSFQSEQVDQPERGTEERTIITGPCSIHSEQMDVNHYWIGIRPSGQNHDETMVTIKSTLELDTAIICEAAGRSHRAGP